VYVEFSAIIDHIAEEHLVSHNGICSSRVSIGGNSRGKLERIISGFLPESEASLAGYGPQNYVSAVRDRVSCIFGQSSELWFLAGPTSSIAIGTHVPLFCQTRVDPSKGVCYLENIE
jgi:hypothetical protein